MIKTILFDLDGTLINTNELIIASFQHTLEHYAPGKYSREDIINFIGEPLDFSLQKVNPERVEEMVAYYREHNLRVHDELVTPYPYIKETLQALKKAGIVCGIVTTKLSTTAERGLKFIGIREYFDVLIGYDHVTNAKPDPEPIKKAMAALSAEQETTLMVGDSPHDIQAGKNAGVKTAGVAWSIKGPERLKQENPDLMLEKMTDLLYLLEVGSL